MAGIFDEVMEGINAKEKQDGKTPPATTQTTPPAPAEPPAQGQTPPATDEAKPMNTYSDDFKGKYGGRKTA